MRRLWLEDLIHFRLAGGRHDHRALFLGNAVEQRVAVAAFIIVMNQPLQHLECVKAERKDLFRDPLGADQLGKVRNKCDRWTDVMREWVLVVFRQTDRMIRIRFFWVQLGDIRGDLSLYSGHCFHHP